MFIVYEYAACVLAVSIVATMLFTTYVVFLVLIEGGSIFARTLRKLTHRATQLKGSWMGAESRDT